MSASIAEALLTPGTDNSPLSSPNEGTVQWITLNSFSNSSFIFSKGNPSFSKKQTLLTSSRWRSYPSFNDGIKWLGVSSFFCLAWGSFSKSPYVIHSSLLTRWGLAYNPPLLSI